jgi:hypothetical protein
MQKVEGSSPFSRSQKSPPNRRVFCWSDQSPPAISKLGVSIGHQTLLDPSSHSRAEPAWSPTRHRYLGLSGPVPVMGALGEIHGRQAPTVAAARPRRARSRRGTIGHYKRLGVRAKVVVIRWMIRPTLLGRDGRHVTSSWKWSATFRRGRPVRADRVSSVAKQGAPRCRADPCERQ